MIQKLYPKYKTMDDTDADQALKIHEDKNWQKADLFK